MYTLLVYIFSIGQPLNSFEVHGYHSIKDCTNGYEIAHKMSIEPTTQSVKAMCYPTDKLNALRNEQK